MPKKTAVKTGDTNFIDLYIILGSVSMSVMAGYIYKRKEEKIES